MILEGLLLHSALPWMRRRVVVALPCCSTAAASTRRKQRVTGIRRNDLAVAIVVFT